MYKYIYTCARPYAHGQIPSSRSPTEWNVCRLIDGIFTALPESKLERDERDAEEAREFLFASALKMENSATCCSTSAKPFG